MGTGKRVMFLLLAFLLWFLVKAKPRFQKLCLTCKNLKTNLHNVYLNYKIRVLSWKISSPVGFVLKAYCLNL